MIHDACKPGDLALVIGGHRGTNIGKTVLVLYDNTPEGKRPKQYENMGTFWRVRAVGTLLNVTLDGLVSAQRMEANCFDAWLMPIRPDDFPADEVTNEKEISHVRT
jgi:hypothetical protein